MSRGERRFHRQFDAIARLVPGLHRPLGALRGRMAFPIRLPLALLLIVGGVFSFLPFLGFWMLPLGLLLLAVDLRALRAPTSSLIIRGRRLARLWGRRLRRRWRNRDADRRR